MPIVATIPPIIAPVWDVVTLESLVLVVFTVLELLVLLGLGHVKAGVRPVRAAWF